MIWEEILEGDINEELGRIEDDIREIKDLLGEMPLSV
jgi:hypothetical protein